MKRAKGAKGKCDKLFSEIIRSVGRCVLCGSTNYLQTAHLVSRRYSATRCDISNAVCACAGCHRKMHDWPGIFMGVVEATIGRDSYDDLCKKAQQITKMDWDEEYLRLKEIYDGLEK